MFNKLVALYKFMFFNNLLKVEAPGSAAKSDINDGRRRGSESISEKSIC